MQEHVKCLDKMASKFCLMTDQEKNNYNTCLSTAHKPCPQ